MDRFDFVVIGAGAAGEAAANAALAAGRSVAVVERELFGGSCPFWACVPSKALLHAASVHVSGEYSWPRASARRDYMINREGRDWPDDSGHVRRLEDAGARIYRGEGRIAGPGVVEVSATAEPSGAGPEGVIRLSAGAIIVATGSQPSLPPLEGLAETNPWTNREATSTRELPRSLVVLGGGAVGIELSSVFARFGVETTLVHSHSQLLEKDHRRSSEAAFRILSDDGVQLRLGVRAARVRAGSGDGGAHVVELSDGGWVQGERILVAVSRAFAPVGVGLESIGLDPKSLPRDGRLCVSEGVYVIGDPAGPEAFTHVSHYQGELAVQMALGGEGAPDYRAIPRAIFLDPEIASVGLSVEGAKEAGLDAFEKVADFATTTRGYEVEAAYGHVAIVVDRGSGLLIGASAVAPDASAAIHEAVLAIQARIPVAALATMIHAFPTTSRIFGGLYTDALKELTGQAVPA
ncbi:MAG TPA: NAD(P)/FAD-dependent oxidoreductase [Candidatus Limnocylindrales bacterium]